MVQITSEISNLFCEEMELIENIREAKWFLTCKQDNLKDNEILIFTFIKIVFRISCLGHTKP